MVDIFFLLVLIILNGVFAMSEIAIVSSRKIRLQQWAEEGRRGARSALRLAEEPTRFLSTVQIGITSISIFSGVYGEAALSDHLRDWLELNLPQLHAYNKPLSVALMVAAITMLSLIFGELVPKRLAMLNPEGIASTLAPPMLLLSRAAAPLVRMLSRLTDTLLRLIGARKSSEPSITEEEIRVLMEQGADEGVFDRAEQELVENIFRLDDRKVAAVMTPRKDIISIDIEDQQHDNRQLLISHGYSRFPVCKGGMEHVLGILDTKRMLDRVLAGQSVDFIADLEIPLYIPATVSLMQLMEQFKLARTHLALVVDEYGELEGLVTMNDVLETVVGDLPSTHAIGEEDDIVRREDGSYLLDGMVTLDAFRQYFDVDSALPGEDTGNIHTLGGVMMYQLGRVPAVTDRFDWQGFSFEVVDMDKTRVDKIMLCRLPSSRLEHNDN
ncbi:hypothetical protein DBR44_02665 [Aquitalea sp. FJL05]|nr:hypothetical protein DBR44_02665 [Aquitalea sp. FJL05]